MNLKRVLAYVLGLIASTLAMYFVTGAQPLHADAVNGEVLALLTAAGLIWTIFFVLAEFARGILVNFRIGLLYLLVLFAVGYFAVNIALYAAAYLNYDGLAFISTIDAKIVATLVLVLVSVVTDSGTREGLTDEEEEENQM